MSHWHSKVIAGKLVRILPYESYKPLLDFIILSAYLSRNADKNPFRSVDYKRLQNPVNLEYSTVQTAWGKTGGGALLQQNNQVFLSHLCGIHSFFASTSSQNRLFDLRATIHMFSNSKILPFMLSQPAPG